MAFITSFPGSEIAPPYRTEALVRETRSTNTNG